MMNYCYNNIDTATDMTPSVPVERENLKMLIRMTNERLNEAVSVAEAILTEIRGAFPRKDDERVNVSSAMDAERLNRDTAERLCCIERDCIADGGGGMSVLIKGMEMPTSCCDCFMDKFRCL